jgi:hypothetical protein
MYVLATTWNIRFLIHSKNELTLVWAAESWLGSLYLGVMQGCVWLSNSKLQCYIVNRLMRHSWASSLERGTISGLYSLVILICISIFSDDPIMHMHTSCSLWAHRVNGSTWTALPHVGALCWFYIFQSLMICYISVWKVVTKKDSIRDLHLANH